MLIHLWMNSRRFLITKVNNLKLVNKDYEVILILLDSLFDLRERCVGVLCFKTSLYIYGNYAIV